jgi:hypothetical protein
MRGAEPADTSIRYAANADRSATGDRSDGCGRPRSGGNVRSSLILMTTTLLPVILSLGCGPGPDGATGERPTLSSATVVLNEPSDTSGRPAEAEPSDSTGEASVIPTPRSGHSDVAGKESEPTSTTQSPASETGDTAPAGPAASDPAVQPLPMIYGTVTLTILSGSLLLSLATAYFLLRWRRVEGGQLSLVPLELLDRLANQERSLERFAAAVKGIGDLGCVLGSVR